MPRRKLPSIRGNNGKFRPFRVSTGFQQMWKNKASNTPIHHRLTRIPPTVPESDPDIFLPPSRYGVSRRPYRRFCGDRIFSGRPSRYPETRPAQGHCEDPETKKEWIALRISKGVGYPSGEDGNTDGKRIQGKIRQVSARTCRHLAIFR